MMLTFTFTQREYTIILSAMLEQALYAQYEEVKTDARRVVDILVEQRARQEP